MAIHLTVDEQVRAAERMLELVRINTLRVPGPNAYNNRFRQLEGYFDDIRAGRKNIQDFFEILLNRAAQANLLSEVATWIYNDRQVGDIYRAHLVTRRQFHERTTNYLSAHVRCQDWGPLMLQVAHCLHSTTLLGPTLAKCRQILSSYGQDPTALEEHLRQFDGMPLQLVQQSAARFASI